MSDRVRQLAQRQAELQARCAAQRALIADEVAAIEMRFSRFDRIARVTRATLLHPAVIAGGVIALLTVGRARGMRLVGRLLVLSTAVRRLVQTVKLFEGIVATTSRTRARREPL